MLIGGLEACIARWSFGEGEAAPKDATLLIVAEFTRSSLQTLGLKPVDLVAPVAAYGPSVTPLQFFGLSLVFAGIAKTWNAFNRTARRHYLSTNGWRSRQCFQQLELRC